MEYSIQQIAAQTGVTSRTLRHYDALGLLTPSSFGINGYRYYDTEALAKLQQILLLRQLGLGLAEISRILSGEKSLPDAIDRHLGLLEKEQERISKQITTLHRTQRALRDEKEITMEEIFEGFDYREHREEVTSRWGKESYESGALWWKSKSDAEKRQFAEEVQSISDAWITHHEQGEDPAAPRVQQTAARHLAWLRSVPGTPAASGDPETLKEYVTGLAEMYVADERFAANYGGKAGAEFVRSALLQYLATIE